MVTLLVASCCIALASGNVIAVTADMLTGEGMVCNPASILAEVPMMYRSFKAKMTVQREREENQRGESLCAS